MIRILFALGAISALTAVAAGAFGAHALRHRLAPELLAVFETGARYQMYHALGALIAALGAERWSRTPALAAGWLFLAGTVLFSGSLYLMALTGSRGLGAMTPVGGASWLVGWLALAWAAARG